MQLYYSGAPEPTAIQTNPILSLGGFISSSRVPNGSIGNLFPPVTKKHVQHNLFDIILIVLTNKTSNEISSYTIWTTVAENDKCAYEIACVNPAYDSVNKAYVFESIDSTRELPYQAELDLRNENNKVEITASLLPGKSIGIWIKRSLDLTKFNELDGNVSNSLTDDQIIEVLREQNSSSTTLEASLIIEY